MAVENSKLKRRILAHERILRALMAQLAEGRPGLFGRMRERLASRRTPVAATVALESYKPARARAAGAPVVVRATRWHGVWHVTQNDVFVGDYLTKEAAQGALSRAADEIAARGDRVEVASGARA